MTGVAFGEEYEQLKRDLEAAQGRIQELETELNRPSTVRNTGESAPEVTPINEADVTLRRLVQRIAMILQAEKIVIMFYDREQGELIGIPPSYGVDEAHLKLFRMRATHGLSGQVFREGEAIIFQDAMTDARTKEDPFGLLKVSNGVSVPLVIEKRDEENRVVERNTIGVLHAFNKRHGEDFIDEDVRLLERMARNVGSIIANLQMYREVVEEREELVQTFEALSAGLILVSPEGKLSQMNGTARAIFGAGSDALGKPAREALPSEPLWHLLDEVAQGNEGGKEEIPVSIKGADYIYEVQAAQVKNEESKDLGIVAIFNDITDIKNIDKMKSSFVAMASHELRTPLTAIKGFSSTLLEGLDEEIYGKEDQREFLGIVVSECDRLRRLIDDLLNTSRIEAGESLKPDYSEFPFEPLLQKVVAVQQQASNKHTVVLSVESELPAKLIGDQDKLDQILTNILNNAIKYSPNGGQVTVHAKQEGDFVLMGVEDQGLGIPKDQLTKVFEKFHRVNNDDNRKIYGTGLGLFLVHHLVTDVHMGEIWVDSEVGEGSTFWVKIPAKLDLEKALALND